MGTRESQKVPFRIFAIVQVETFNSWKTPQVSAY